MSLHSRTHLSTRNFFNKKASLVYLKHNLKKKVIFKLRSLRALSKNVIFIITMLGLGVRVNARVRAFF